MLLRDLPDEETPASRLFRLGPAALSNAELLSLLMLASQERIERATSILAKAGGLAGLAGKGSEELAEMGVKPYERARVLAAIELARRLPSEGLAGRDLLNDPRLVKDYLRATQNDEGQEHTGVLLLNARNRLLSNIPAIYRGTLDRAVVEPREILRRAILGKAASIILYHNHPSGEPTPSREDREFTRRLNSAAEAVGVRLLDHIVIGREGCVSFREAGLL